MKTKFLLIFTFCLFLLSGKTFSQISTDSIDKYPDRIYLIIKHDGVEYVGKIISQDAREVLIETRQMGQIIIPKHEIKEIRELGDDELGINDEYLSREVFATRYFFTTNGLPIGEGEAYIQWNLFGPDFQFGVGKSLSVGIMTTWIGIPVIGTVKYSFELGRILILELEV